MKKLMGEFGPYFGFSVSHTTRTPRPGEEDGREYHFVNKEEMENMINKKQFIENTVFSGNLYGTSMNAVQDVLDSGKICILDIDVQGVKAVKETDLNPYYIFIKPPSIDTLEERLTSRGTETKASLFRRLGAARAEMEYGQEDGNFDIIIVNDNLEKAYREMKQFLQPIIDKVKPKHLCPTPLVICGPSGSGKSTCIKMLLNEFPGYVGFSVSHTTRNPWPGELDGIDYHFVTEDEFQKLVDQNEFIEYTMFAGNYYGTRFDSVQDVLDSGKICLLDIDVSGVRKIKESDLKCKYVFIAPPTIETLETRLRSRGTETKGSLLRRLGAANHEMEYGLTPGNFDIIITNDSLEDTFEELKSFLAPLARKLIPPGPSPLVLCGPSGSGKSTLMKLLMEEYGEYFGFCVSHTTRQPRPGEVDGKDYHFTSRDEMTRLIADKEFIENAEFSGNLYGTSKTAVQDVLDSGKICILDIDTQGVRAVKKTSLKPRYVFMKPPSLKVLEQRLRARGTETEQSLAKRNISI